jgi:murein DD-endopeptidase MepM/ murein hydrolase activator NlpD
MDVDNEWQRPKATLSDKTARKEFALSQDEIIQAIRAGRLQYRENASHGNPHLRLLRREAEALVASKRGATGLKEQKAKAELACVEHELRQHRRQISLLEKRRAKLVESLGLEEPAPKPAKKRK